jgi:hypothetical protein
MLIVLGWVGVASCFHVSSLLGYFSSLFFRRFYTNTIQRWPNNNYYCFELDWLHDIQFAIGFIAAWFGAVLKLDRWNLLSDFAALNASSASPCSLEKGNGFRLVPWLKKILPWHC